MTSRLNQTMCHVVAAVAPGASLAARSAEIQQAGPSPQERVAALKQSMQESQTELRQYEWIETTIISLKGEEKARTQKRCSHIRIDAKRQALDALDEARRRRRETGTITKTRQMTRRSSRSATTSRHSHVTVCG